MRNTQQENRFLTVDFFFECIRIVSEANIVFVQDCAHVIVLILYTTPLPKLHLVLHAPSVPGRGRRARPTNEARSLCVSSAMQGEVFFFFLVQ